ncbi:hypothetical protein ISS07_05910 [Candidatus Woesearchaeota archaeon]|nr:hypothetical protein [Candidatus Woesearchaeota archaeon]
MLKKISLESAEKYLADVAPDSTFWVYEGPKVRNLYELTTVLENMDDTAFHSHVHNGRNDFANWVRDVIKDITLAEKIKKVHDRKSAFKIVWHRVEQLGSVIDKSNKKQLDIENTTIKDILDDLDMKSLIFFGIGLAIGTIIGVLVASP